MWSDRYNYYNIQSDKFCSKELETKDVIRVLSQVDCLKRESHQSFRNATFFPWLSLIAVKAQNGSYVSSKEEIPFVNLISIVCSKGAEINQQIYIDIFLVIARELGWKLYLEEDDDDNVDIEING